MIGGRGVAQFLRLQHDLNIFPLIFLRREIHAGVDAAQGFGHHIFSIVLVVFGLQEEKGVNALFFFLHDVVR